MINELLKSPAGFFSFWYDLIVMENNFPRIDFIYNSKTDADCAVGFFSESKLEADDNFLKGFFPNELYLTIENELSNDKKEKVIRDYVSEYYEQNETGLKDRFKFIESDWENVEIKYFNLVKQLFNAHPWPDGEYTGLGTIFHCYPRFISKKVFFFPLNHKVERFANKVIAHEMLHFMFFDYVEKKYELGEKSEIDGKGPNYLWKVSEAFNSVIEGWQPYSELFNSKPHPYPEVVEIYTRMNEQWEKDQNVVSLLGIFLET